jgi:hypothetical protein
MMSFDKVETEFDAHQAYIGSVLGASLGPICVLI